MSVTAAVFKRLEDIVIPEGVDMDHLLIDESTGQVYLDDASQMRLPLSVALEVDKPLGNVARICYLRDEISQAFGQKAGASLLLNAVLYDGTHCGDLIQIEDRDRLKEEVEWLRKVGPAEPDMASFLSDIEELIFASQRCGNPIVFL